MTDANEADQKKAEMEAEELKGRLAEFNKELVPILQKYEFALGAEPFILNGQILARPLVLDARKLPKPQQPAPKDAAAEGGVTEA